MFKGKFSSIIIFSLFIVSIASCGYRVHKSTLDSVRIGSIENRTFEHGLEDKLKVILGEELLKNSIRVSDNSPHMITGVIDTFELRGVAQKGDITIQYEVYITGKFSLIKEGYDVAVSPAEKKVSSVPCVPAQIPLRAAGLFPVTFVTEGSLGELTSLKEEAAQRALRDLSSEIIASIIYNQ